MIGIICEKQKVGLRAELAGKLLAILVIPILVEPKVCFARLTDSGEKQIKRTATAPAVDMAYNLFLNCMKLEENATTSVGDLYKAYRAMDLEGKRFYREWCEERLGAVDSTRLIQQSYLKQKDLLQEVVRKLGKGSLKSALENELSRLQSLSQGQIQQADGNFESSSVAQ